MSHQQFFSRTASVLTILLTFALCLEVTAQQQTPQNSPAAQESGRSLFHRSPQRELPALNPGDERVVQSVLARTAIEVDWAALQRIRDAGGGTLAVDLGEKGSLTVRVQRVIPNRGGGYSLSGSIDGFPRGEFLSTVHEDALIASIRTGDKNIGDFAVQLNPAGTHEFRHLDRTVLPGCDGAIDPSADSSHVHPALTAAKKKAAGAPDHVRGGLGDENTFQPLSAGAEQSVPLATPLAVADDGSVLDIMIVYTPAARNSQGGTSGMIAAINQAFNEANQALSASGVSTSFRLAHHAEVAYSESTDDADLTALRNSADGLMDEVHALRNSYSADVVSLWTQSSYGGLGYLMTSLNSSFESYAFNVCDIDAVVGNLTFAHETAHNLGCAHDVANADSALYPYSYGWRWYGISGNQYRSIMAYSPGTRVPRFSNPAVNYDGVATGDSTGANNALTINNARVTASNWRAGAPLPDDHGNSIGTATLIGPTSTTNGNLETAGDNDYFRINVIVAGVLLLQTNGSTDTFGHLLNSAGALLTADDDAGVGTNFLITHTVAPGTYYVRVRHYSTGSGSYQLTASQARSDFSRDGKSDLVWQNSAGERALWLMNGTSLSSGSNLGSVDPQWDIAGTGDFNNDGSADILWHNLQNGQVVIWLMNGGSFSSGAAVLTVHPSWRVGAVGDFNGDGRSDIVWQNTGTGARAVWFMSGTSLSGTASLTSVGTEWQIRGAGDFNGDGRCDIVWQNANNGARAVWLMNGTSLTGSANLPSASPEWDIAGTGDFDFDGKVDLVWQQRVTGARALWLMNGTTLRSGVSLGTVPPNWTIKNH